MPLPTTLEEYAAKRLSKLEKQLEDKYAIISALQERNQKAMAILEAMHPHMSNSGRYATFDTVYPDEGTRLFGYLVDLGLIPVETILDESGMQAPPGE